MRLKIGDDFLDLYGSEVLAQTFAVNEIGDISNRQASLSNNFNIPLSAKNRELLGFPDDINSSSSFPYSKVACTLFDNGVAIVEGYLRFQVVDDLTLQASFFGDNANWFTLIKDLDLVDLDLSEFDHDWTYTNIADAISADKESGYTYPLIDYGDFSTNDTLYIFSNQMFPAMFVSTLFAQIFYDAGWKVDGELIDHPLFKRMIVPFSGPSFSHSNDYVNTHSFTQAKDIEEGPFIIDTPLTWDNVDTTIPVTATGVYNVVVYLEITGTIVPTDTIRFQINAVTYQTLEGITSNGIYRWIVEGVDLQAGDEITIRYIIAGGSSVTVTTNSFVEITLTPEITRGSEIQISQTLPDIKQTDFIRYVCFIFGAIPQANQFSKTVTFSLFKSIKGNIGSALDWSNKLDMSKSRQINFTELLDNYAKRSILTYAEDGDDNELKAYQAEIGQIFGEGVLEIDNDHLPGEAVVYEAPFTPMININSFANTMYIPQIKFIEDGERSIEPSPKIAILSENFPVSTLSANQYSVLRIYDDPDEYETDYADVTDIPFCWFAKVAFIDEIDALTDNLSFDQIQFPTAVGESLIERFLIDYQSILNNMKYLRASVHLTDADVKELDFTTPVYIDRFKSYFYISKINNYQGSNQTTEVELVKISS